MSAALLTPAQLAGLRKLGDILIPGDGELPSFSASGCAEQADRMLAYMNEGDRDGITTLLAVFRVLPGFAIRALVRLTEHHTAVPEPLAGLLRMINLGVKGVVMTLYYSGIDEGGAVFRAIGWDAKVVDSDFDAAAVAGSNAASAAASNSNAGSGGGRRALGA
ncbi:MAG: hypothetical protein ACRERC_16950, partial [Candidatus Binatia bacterium]